MARGLRAMTALTKRARRAKRARARARRAKRARTLPVSVDWRKKGILGGDPPHQLKDTCWAHVVADCVEASLKLGRIYDVTPSMQELVDCCFVAGATNGGSLTQALDRIIVEGVSNSDVYPPRTQARGRCLRHNEELPTTEQFIKIKGYRIVPCSELKLMEAVAKTSVAIAVICGGTAFCNYSGGVLRTGIYRDVFRRDGTRRRNVIAHAMTIIGFDEDKEDGPYWIIRNTFGIRWGENGFLKLHRSLTPLFLLAVYPYGAYLD